ncbi:MAG: hypothetical protein QM776_06795 [Rhodocyclaceae bacterium]
MATFLLATRCPACQGDIVSAPDIRLLMCPACHAEVAVNAGQLTVVRQHAVYEQRASTLTLGTRFDIEGIRWQLIGLLRFNLLDSKPATEATHYLLASPAGEFNWLIETDEAWWRARSLVDKPDEVGDNAVPAGVGFHKRETRVFELVYAEGAFDWSAVPGSRLVHTEYFQLDSVLLKQLAPSDTRWMTLTAVEGLHVHSWLVRESGASVPTDKPLFSAAALKAAGEHDVGRVAKAWVVVMIALLFGYFWLESYISGLALFLLKTFGSIALVIAISEAVKVVREKESPHGKPALYGSLAFTIFNCSNFFLGGVFSVVLFWLSIGFLWVPLFAVGSAEELVTSALSSETEKSFARRYGYILYVGVVFFLGTALLKAI